MPEIIVISGKGGTGKTTVTAALAQLAENAVICDLDVDTPDLHLILAPEREAVFDFYAGHRAEIDPELCRNCGVCADMCRFGAVSAGPEGYRIDPVACEGCNVCVTFCPAGAIRFPQQRCGRTYRSQTRFGPMVHARLFPGEENSGLLVSRLRDDARALAHAKGCGMILADGAPGIGCPVISSLTGTDLAVAVTEPSLSGCHDLERIVDLTAHFRVPTAVIMNKADMNPTLRNEVHRFCKDRGLPVIAELPFDPAATGAMVAGRTVVEQNAEALARPLRAAWDKIVQHVTARKAA